MAAQKHWFDWLFKKDRRRAERHSSLPLVAYYWDGESPKSHPVRDISSAGMYLCTEERWYPKTLIVMSLVRTDKSAPDPNRAIKVAGQMVRAGSDGVGLQFILRHSARRSAKDDSYRLREADKKTLLGFLASVRSDAARQTAS